MRIVCKQLGEGCLLWQSRDAKEVACVGFRVRPLNAFPTDPIPPRYVVLSTVMGEDVPSAVNLVLTNADGLPGVLGHLALPMKGRAVSLKALSNRAKESGKQWIRMETAVLGDADITGHANNIDRSVHPPPSFFNNMRWLGFRKWMLTSAGLDPAFRPQSSYVVLNDKRVQDGFYSGQLDRRQIINIKEVEEHLKKALPAIRVESIKFVPMPWAEQLKKLSETTVFITTQGSAAFRFVFLPPGASVIFLSHPVDITPGAPPTTSVLPFHEVDKYFSLSYLRFLKYWVSINSTNEYAEWDVNDPKRRDIYHSHIIVNLTRIEPLVRAGDMLYWQYRTKPVGFTR